VLCLPFMPSQAFIFRHRPTREASVQITTTHQSKGREFDHVAILVIGAKLRASGIGADEITDVLFAGGVCQAPEIQKRVMRDYPNARQRSTVAGTSVALRLHIPAHGVHGFQRIVTADSNGT
jgi:hypothetical protein